MDGFSTGGHKLQKGVRAQFYEKAPGVSIEAVLGTLDPTVNFGAFKNISHDNVIRAATFDLLFTESDRHGQNVFLAMVGVITLIDIRKHFRRIEHHAPSGPSKIRNQSNWILDHSRVRAKLSGRAETVGQPDGHFRLPMLHAPSPICWFRFPIRRGTFFEKNSEHVRKIRRRRVQNDPRRTRGHLKKLWTKCSPSVSKAPCSSALANEAETAT